MNSWYLKGGYESVIFVPSTPDSILQQRYQSDVNCQGLRIRVVEKAGWSVKSMVQRSDPFQLKRCGQESCLECATGGKGSCGKEVITYSITLNNCAKRGIVRVYIYISVFIFFMIRTLKKLHIHELTNSSLQSHYIQWLKKSQKKYLKNNYIQAYKNLKKSKDYEPMRELQLR